MHSLRLVLPLEGSGAAEFLALPVIWCVFVGVLAVVMGRRVGISRPQLPHRWAVPGREPWASEPLHDLEATERRIRSLEERLDFTESLLDGRSRTARDPFVPASRPRPDSRAASTGSASLEEA